MKKLAVIVALTGAATYGALAQGFFNFASTTAQVFDVFTAPASPALSSGTVKIGFLFAPANSIPTWGASASSTAANSVVTQAQVQSILNDSTFTVAQLNSGGQATVNTSSGLNKGKFSLGTVAIADSANVTLGNNGGTVTVVEFGWAGTLASPTAFGWSTPVQYTYANNLGTPSNFSQSGITGSWGVDVVAVPEPATMALAALGGASMLLFRRRK